MSRQAKMRNPDATMKFLNTRVSPYGPLTLNPQPLAQ